MGGLAAAIGGQQVAGSPAGSPAGGGIGGVIFL